MLKNCHASHMTDAALGVNSLDLAVTIKEYYGLEMVDGPVAYAKILQHFP